MKLCYLRPAGYSWYEHAEGPGASAWKDLQSSIFGIHATGPRTSGDCRLRIGSGSERGEAGVGRGPLSGSPGGGVRYVFILVAVTCTVWVLLEHHRKPLWFQALRSIYSEKCTSVYFQLLPPYFAKGGEFG